MTVFLNPNWCTLWSGCIRFTSTVPTFKPMWLTYRLRVIGPNAPNSSPVESVAHRRMSLTNRPALPPCFSTARKNRVSMARSTPRRIMPAAAACEPSVIGLIPVNAGMMCVRHSCVWYLSCGFSFAMTSSSVSIRSYMDRPPGGSFSGGMPSSVRAVAGMPPSSSAPSGPGYRTSVACGT